MGARTRDIAPGKTGTRLSAEQADYLRWRVERPDGRRSLTWFVTTSAKGKLLIGSHQLIGTMQLSFLQGSWLIECSGDFTRRRLPREEDESICDYWMRAPKVDDWYQASVICFPTTTLAPMFEDQPPCSGVRKHRWDPRSSDEVLEVQILLGDADSEAPTISDAGGLIGHVDLRRSVAVAVVSEARMMDIHTQRVIEGHRALATTSPRQASRYGWGITEDVPVIIDLAGLGRAIRA